MYKLRGVSWVVTFSLFFFAGRVLGMWRQEAPPMEESLHLWER